MNNKFILNETTGIGIIEDDKSNNILFKTEGNEEEVSEVLEKENEVENVESILIDIENEMYMRKIEFVPFIVFFMLCFIPTLIFVKDTITLSFMEYLTDLFDLSCIALILIIFFCVSVVFLGGIIETKKIIDFLNNLCTEYAKEKEKLEQELEKLKSNTNITKMQNINIETINPMILSPAIVYPQDNTQNTDTLNNSGKAKTLKKEF